MEEYSHENSDFYNGVGYDDFGLRALTGQNYNMEDQDIKPKEAIMALQRKAIISVILNDNVLELKNIEGVNIITQDMSGLIPDYAEHAYLADSASVASNATNSTKSDYIKIDSTYFKIGTVSFSNQSEVTLGNLSYPIIGIQITGPVGFDVLWSYRIEASSPNKRYIKFIDHSGAEISASGKIYVLDIINTIS